MFGQAIVAASRTKTRHEAAFDETPAARTKRQMGFAVLRVFCSILDAGATSLSALTALESYVMIGICSHERNERSVPG